MARSSPFEAIYRQLGAKFDEYDGWILPKEFAGVEPETAALKQASVAFDLSSFGRLNITGPGSGGLVEKFLADSEQQIPEGKWIWAPVSGKGGAGFVVRLGRSGQDSYTVLTEPADRADVAELLQTCAEGVENAGLEDVTEKTGMLGIYGPGAYKAVTSILPFDLNGLGEFAVAKFTVLVISAVLLRGSWVGCDGVEIICPLSAAALAGTAIARYQKKAGISPAGMDCLLKEMMNRSNSTAGGR